MDKSRIGEALDSYQKALDTWLEEDLSLDNALSVLRSRDILQEYLKQEITPEVELLKKIQELDSELRKQGAAMATQVNFEDFQKTLSTLPEQWWWSPEEVKVSHPSDKYDWLFNGIGLGAWTISLALLADISRRFLLGGAGIGGLSFVTFSNILALISIHNDLKKSETTEKENKEVLLLSKIKVPSHWHTKIRSLSKVILAWTFFILWLSLPGISNRYNTQGVQDQQNQQFSVAVKNFIRAITLDPENTAAHYNLATTYEDMRKFDLAKEQYEAAVDGREPRAFSSLARLYIFEESDESIDQAVALLQEGIQYVPKENLSMQFSFYKNLGWARLKQGYFDEAEEMLTTAIHIEEELNQQKSQEQAYTPGAAYCLLAQTLEAQGSSDALEVWERCCQLADSTKLGEDAWLFEARTQIKQKGGSPQKSSCKSINPPTF